MIVSFSGGKNSTAMLILLKQLGIRIDGIVFADTGAELPETYEFIAKVEDRMKQKIDVVRHPLDWFDWFYRPYTRGKRRGQIHGFPITILRGASWCTRSLKLDPINRYANGRQQLVGIAADEYHRAKGQIYPLIEWKLTSLDCYNICVENDLLNPIYHRIGRSGCWTCPNQSSQQLRMLYAYYPDLWARLLKLEDDSPTRFCTQFTLKKLDALFQLQKAGQER